MFKKKKIEIFNILKMQISEFSWKKKKNKDLAWLQSHSHPGQSARVEQKLSNSQPPPLLLPSLEA